MRAVSSWSPGFAVLRREANEGGFFRPIVFTIPKRLRVFFKFNRRLLGDLSRCAFRSLSCYFEIVAGIVGIRTYARGHRRHPDLWGPD